MNIFRWIGDMSHLLSFLVLIFKMHASRSCAGISLKTQELYALVFITRYLDLFWNFYSMYNSIMKILFISLSLIIVWTIRYKDPQCRTYSADADAFPTPYLIIPCLLLGLTVNQDHTEPTEWLWAFSIYLEAVAIIPQLFVLQKMGECESLTSHYVFLLGMYRFFYLLNWVWRYFHEYHYSQIIVWTCGVVQTALYCDFFYNYFMAKRRGVDAPVKIAALPV